MATEARKPQRHRRRLGTLSAMDCQGKSKFFLEHQALRQEEGNKGYDTNVHGWRFAQQLPLPEGKWPPLRKFSKSPLDEQQKEERAQRSREEKQQLDEEIQRYRRIAEEIERRKKQFPPGKAPSDEQLGKEIGREKRRARAKELLARAEERHLGNVQMAMRIINRRYPDRKYELREITEKNGIYEFGSAYCHYNFTVYSPTHGSQLCFAEVDINTEYEQDIYRCCVIGSGPYGSCVGCLNQRVPLIHPSNDRFTAGHERFGGFCTDDSDIDSDDDN